MIRRPNKALLRKTVSVAAGGTTSPTGFWNLSEASGSSRNDSCSSPVNLSITGTVTQVAGKIGNAASVASGSNYLSGSGSKLNHGGTFSICGWFYLDNSAGGTVATSGLSTTGWKLTASTTNLVLTTKQMAGSTSLTLGGTYTLSTWNFFAAYYDSSVLGLSANGGSFTTGAGTAPASTNDIVFLSDADIFTPNALQGRLDEFGYFVGYKLTSTEKDDLYNSGTGKTFNGSAWV